MLSGARIFAAVTFFASCLAGSAAWAQVQNLEAGKSASQLFAGTCNACHKSPRGLLKTVSPGSLPGFLREHYTTSGDMASQLSSYLISNGATDTRQAKPGTDKQGVDKQGQGGNDQADRQGRRNRNAPPQEAARPDDGAVEGARQSRKRQARPGEPADDARAPAQAAIERAPDGRRLKRSGRPGQPGIEEPSVASEPAKMEPPKADSVKAEPSADDKAKAEAPKSETLKGETGAAERAKSDSDAKSNEAKIEAPKDAGAGDKPAVRRDPAPAVAPASPAAAMTAPAPATASGGSSEPAAPQPKAAASEPPTVTASTPRPPPSAPQSPQAGQPTPPISQ